MGTLGHVLGGIGAAVGGAMIQRATTEAQQRHEMVLERVRAENRRADMNLQADLNDRNSSRSDARGDFYQGRSVARQTAATMTVDASRAAQRETEAQNDFRRSVSMAELQTRLQTESAATRARIEREMEANDIQDIREGRDGKLYGITRTGRRVDLGIMAPVAQTSGGSSLLLQQPGIGAGAGAQPQAPADMMWTPERGLVPAAGR